MDSRTLQHLVWTTEPTLISTPRQDGAGEPLPHSEYAVVYELPEE